MPSLQSPLQQGMFVHRLQLRALACSTCIFTTSQEQHNALSIALPNLAEQALIIGSNMHSVRPDQVLLQSACDHVLHSGMACTAHRGVVSSVLAYFHCKHTASLPAILAVNKISLIRGLVMRQRKAAGLLT